MDILAFTLKIFLHVVGGSGLETFCSVAAVTVVNFHSVLEVLLFILGLYIWKPEVIAHVSSL